MFNFLISAMDATTIIMLVLLAIMVVVLIVLPMFTNKRRNKAINELHSSLRPGDVIKTVGGVVGKIVEVKEVSPVDKEMVVETGIGDSKCTMVFDVQAVYQVLSKVDAPAAPVAPEIAESKPAEESVEEVPVVEEPVSEVKEEVPAEEQKAEEAATTETVEPEMAPSAATTPGAAKTAAVRKPRAAKK